MLMENGYLTLSRTFLIYWMNRATEDTTAVGESPEYLAQHPLYLPNEGDSMMLVKRIVFKSTGPH